MVKYISTVIKKFSLNKKVNVFLAGGLFANIKINQKIADLEHELSLQVLLHLLIFLRSHLKIEKVF